MNWIAQHTAPSGIFSRFHTDEWVQAAIWLANMIFASDAEGWRDATKRLNRAPHAAAFTASAGQHCFEIRAAA